MISLRLVSVIVGLKVFFLCTFSFPVAPLAAAGDITPDRVITVVADQPAIPEWKTLWDEARKNVQENKYPAASKLYERLFRIKPNIEAANWEYCKVLLQNEDYSSAAKIIFPLLEKNPNRIDYLMAAGVISLQQKEYALAIKQYGKAYESDPGGVLSTDALEGLIAGLKGAGKYEFAFSLQEQLHVRQPGNAELLYELARDAELLQEIVKAKSYYSKLLGKNKIAETDDRIIFNAAKLFEKADSKVDAVPLWREYIRRNPNYLPFYQKLADFFLEKEDGKSALVYLLFLSEKVQQTGPLLLQIAEINLHELGRPDKALSYYEKYIVQHPDDRDVAQKISNIQSILANDFLSIVENDGAWLLWRDLEKIAPSRLAIYLKMAALLEKKGKFDEQLELLLIIYDHNPLDDTITYKIVDNYRKRKKYSQALEYLKKITAAHNTTKRHFLLKGAIEELEGLEVMALASFIDGLHVDKSDLHLRSACISKAGSLGMVTELEEMFKENPLSSYRSKDIKFILNYFDQLSYNSLFGRLEAVHSHFLTLFKKHPQTLFKLQSHRAKTLRIEGKSRRAEELNRKLLNLGISDSEILFTLTSNAIEDNNIEAAMVWHTAFSDKIETFPESRKKTLQEILNSKSAGKAAEIPSQQDLYIGKQPVLSRLLQAARVELEHGEYDSAHQHLDAVLETGIDSLVGKVLWAELLSARGEIGGSIASYKTIHERFPEEYLFFKRLIENESKRGRYENGLALILEENKELRHVETASSYSDLSPDFEEILLLARMLWGSKQLEKSLKVYELLLYPQVIELLEKRFELEEIDNLYFSKEKSFWHSLLFLLQTEPEVVAELMAPPFVVDNMGNETGKIVVEHYELYSWQKSISNEYLARKAIVQRKYAAAERNYKRLFEEEESTEGLRDLASIYDRFGEYRKEAQVYEKIRSTGVASPELMSSMDKTSLKIRPHTGLDMGYLRKRGRDGYVNLENIRFGTSLFFTPDLEKDIKFQFFRNNYGEFIGNESLPGIFLESAGTIEILHDTDLLFSGSAEKFDGKSGTNFYYSLGLRSQLDDYFNAYMEAYRAKVDDTLEAVVEGIYSDGFEIGLLGETSGGLTVGGDYRHRYFSDGNSQNRFHAFTSYKIYREAMHFGFQYDYQYLDNSDSNENDEKKDSESGGPGIDKLYWKPANYSEHELTLHFQQLIRGDYGSDDLLSYYTFDNSVSLEDPQNILYTGEFDIFLEMSPHYLLKGNFLFTNSDDYEEMSFLFSIFYRW